MQNTLRRLQLCRSPSDVSLWAPLKRARATSGSSRSTLTEKLARSFKLDLVHEGRSLGPVTLSLGVASFPDHGHSWEAVVAAADAALYSAKRAGRNRVVVGSSEVDRVSAVSR